MKLVEMVLVLVIQWRDANTWCPCGYYTTDEL